MHLGRVVAAVLMAATAALSAGCAPARRLPAGAIATRPQAMLHSPLPTPTEAMAVPTPSPSAAAPVLSSQASAPPPTGLFTAATPGGPPVYSYRVVATYPHDPKAFTQGLAYDDGALYEGTGLAGQSTLRRVDLETGQVLKAYALPDVHFGEGIALFDGRIAQLTWKSHLGFVYDKDSFRLLRTFSYATEGWGLAFDGERLVMSDGTAELRFLDPIEFTQTGQIQVHDDQGPVVGLNELEWVQAEFFANVYRTDRIARIDPITGQVTGWIDLSGLLEQAGVNQSVGVLNGIAYDAEGDRLFVTGKLWPLLFEIDLEHPR